MALKAYREGLDEEFELDNDTVVPVGDHTFLGVEAIYEPGGGRSIDAGLVLQAGEFYDGSRLSLGVRPRWSISPQLNFNGFFQVNRVSFPDRDQDYLALISRLKAEVTLTTSFSAFAFIQYNGAVDTVMGNIRIRFNPREGTDFYLVYNEGINTDRLREIPNLPYHSDRTIMLKYASTFIF